MKIGIMHLISSKVPLKFLFYRLTELYLIYYEYLNSEKRSNPTKLFFKISSGLNLFQNLNRKFQ
jgi:hypothetical protein